MPKIIHFEISADDPTRASAFYESVFDWRINKWEGPVDYWLVSTDDRDQTSINGAIRQRMRNETTVNTVDVPSIDEFTQRVVSAGGRIVVTKSVVPGVGYNRLLCRHGRKPFRDYATRSFGPIT